MSTTSSANKLSTAIIIAVSRRCLTSCQQIMVHIFYYRSTIKKISGIANSGSFTHEGNYPTKRWQPQPGLCMGADWLRRIDGFCLRLDRVWLVHPWVRAVTQPHECTSIPGTVTALDGCSDRQQTRTHFCQRPIAWTHSSVDCLNPVIRHTT